MALSQHPEKMKKGVIENWHPEDKAFWEKTGQKIASRNYRVIYGFLFLVYCYPSASGCYLVQSLSI